MFRHGQTLLLWLTLPALTSFSACGGNPVDHGSFTGRTGGCSNFEIYRFDAPMMAAVVVNARASKLTVDRTPREYSLPHTGLDVRIEAFNAPARAHYCDDVLETREPAVIREWTAVSGTIRITGGDTLSAGSFETVYTVFAVLRDATFRDKAGEIVRIDELDFGEVTVGWLPG